MCTCGKCILRTYQYPVIFLELQQVYKKMADDRGVELSCCKYNSVNNKCWKHFLVKANIENLGDTEIESDWITWLKSSASMVNRLTCLRLTWKCRDNI